MAVPLRCDHVADLLAESADGRALPEGIEADHVARCLRCQAHRAHYRRLSRELAAMRQRRLQPPGGLVEEVLAYIDEAVLQARHRLVTARRAAYLGGLAAATAAGAAGALVLRRKRPA